jgi:hypothetical protein
MRPCSTAVGPIPIPARNGVAAMKPILPLPRPRWSCPGPEQLAALADGRVDASARTQLEAHVADCDACLAAIGWLARAVDAPAPAVPPALLDQASSVTDAPGEWHARRWISAAAAAILVFAVGSLLLQQRRAEMLRPDVQAVRGLAAADLQVIEPLEGGALAKERGHVRWQPVPRALYYEIRLTDLDGALAWEGRTETTEIVIPSAVLQSFSNGFLWVTAQQPDNRSVRSRAMAVSVGSR